MPREILYIPSDELYPSTINAEVTNLPHKARKLKWFGPGKKGEHKAGIVAQEQANNFGRTKNSSRERQD